ncbi:MAG: glycerol-3-phosphate ABC transporter ATP-binding protein [Omnitrophica WOR_2 bacterium GWF2_43_52]|nr:MAG: glycerol-3-phosphate ABC transporter ATP-binding protein [Omnitrophica WOR_2 bacterium GWA2_44_7]OGX16939.1 MAG: glycerol-3-phosphate ABC transporter ATP-binding protein [Omnitrophica WOR_2 bacterium GWC2_44_8]OGX21129.1 MAG: glycerol-3-phosphate ABC transporter ATP-binding protein [Omnitrophica WOR_2 bacterium GWF2_43_52]OGX55140.1 MAG: glycerol-3-phosphate ABC transporter ATP-binding protein [Omnitrophica WOR_2 bacterium RIFOXYC2_FULL_43_9]HAH19933.1 glycerol-3-phosphate ABC transport
MAQVSLKDVSKVYPGGVTAVNKVSLGIENKEFMVLVGPSGCGKSTTLRMIAGLEEISSGELYLGDKLVNDVPAKDRDIAMVFQNYALYPHMTVFENMAFGLKLRRYPKAEIEKRVNDAAGILGLKRLFSRRPKELSGGERQRVAVGRAIVRKPLVFLFDEPLSNLDAKLRVQMRTEIHKLHLRLATTMIYVTHDQTEAMTMGDRIAVMKDGLVQQVADPITIYDHPVNKFVASFIGSPPMNFMLGRIIKKDSRFYFDEGKIKVKIVEEMNRIIASYAGKEIFLGIRSEDIYDKLFVSTAPPENIVRATCEVVEPLGSEVYLYLNTGKHSFIARVGAHDRPLINQDMDLVFDMSKVHFFDKDTEATVV